MDTEPLEFKVETAGERLDKVIVAQIGDRLSRARIQALIKDGLVTVNGTPAKPGIKLKGGEHIRVTVPQRESSDVVLPEQIPLNIIYEDDDLAVIDKPAGMTVHPGVGSETGTLVSAMLARWPEIIQMNTSEKRAGIVHRLDKDTSGLIVIARSDTARRKLAEQFQERIVEKTYLALLERAPKTRVGRIEAPIGRDPLQRKRMAVQRDGKPAVTEFTVVDDNFKDGQALVKVHLLTGRTHQIRVHMAFIGCPIVGDTVYGFHKQRVKLKRHFLHAASLGFEHPRTGDWMEFESPLPPGLQNILDKLRA